MYKKALLLLLLVCLLFAMSGCCIHKWQEATCTEPETCSKCGETQGEALGHDYGPWEETKAATCTEEGMKISVCSICGDTRAQYTTKLSHTPGEWTVATPSTCEKAGKETTVCTMCGETMERLLPLAEHTPGEWEVTVLATADKPGEQVQRCTVCGEVLKTEESTKTAEEVKQDYIAKCSSYTFDQIARNPEDYRGNYAVLRGEVIQVEQGGWYNLRLRVDITPASYGWTDTIYINCRKGLNDPNILEGDIVTFYGQLNGTYTYTAILGQKVTLPYLDAQYYQIEY